MKIAVENEESRKKLIKEEKHQATFVKHLWISRHVPMTLNTAKYLKLRFFTCSSFCCFGALLILCTSPPLPSFFYIFSALSLTSQFLLSSLLSPDVFPNFHTIDVHLLDLNGDEEDLHQLKNELEHQALPLLHQVQPFRNFIFFFFTTR